MYDRDLLIRALDLAVWEMGEAFQGLEDRDVWKRPDPRLLSVGELATHASYWEAKSFFEEVPESPLTANYSRYYTTSVDNPIESGLGAVAVLDEIKNIHDMCKNKFLSELPDLASNNPHREGWKWGFTLQYQAFHFAYHTGQMYSVRHLLGHTTVDN